jgi:hypothetical protein
MPKPDLLCLVQLLNEPREETPEFSSGDKSKRMIVGTIISCMASLIAQSGAQSSSRNREASPVI